MKFPSIGDIATTKVVSIDIRSTFEQAISKMLDYEHRNIIVTDLDKYYLLSVVDILSIRAKNISIDITLDKLNLLELPVIDKRKNILEILEYLNSGTEYLCVVENNELYGLVTHSDIISNIDPDTLMDNYRLDDFLKLGRRMKWVNKDEQISNLLQDMIENQYDNVIVVEDLKPVGIFTTKDITVMIKNREDLDVCVSTHMSSPVDSIDKSASIREALNFVKEKKFKRVVVTDSSGYLSGVISQKELISLTYSRWAMMMKEYQEELSEINKILVNKNEKFENIASTDSLTGLYNRYKFSELYVSSYRSMIQRDNNMSLIMVDIDYFKNVNDTYGHNAGDATLVQVAHAILRVLRNIDIVCRWGGEEFIILLPTANLENAVLLAEKIRKDIERMDIDIVGQVTASFGIAKVNKNTDMKAVVNIADKALYLAKNSGRNCVKTVNDL